MRNKYKTAVTVLSLLLASTVLICGSRMLSQASSAQNKQRVVASFYPIYIAALNLTQGAQELEVVNLTDSQTGCLHDFTLRPQDMVTLERASVFLINGGGMEGFLETVAASYPDLPVIDSSTGVEMLEDDPAHSISFGEEAEEEPNAHCWLSPSRYIQQIENLRDGLTEQFPQYTSLFAENAQTYIEKVRQLQDTIRAQMAGYPGRSVIIFHDAFAYFAEEAGVQVAQIIQVESDTALSSSEIARAVDLINQSGVRYLFAEAQYSTELADAIARETKAKVYTLDTAVSGESDPDAYLNAMYANLDTLTRSFKD